MPMRGHADLGARNIDSPIAIDELSAVSCSPSEAEHLSGDGSPHDHDPAHAVTQLGALRYQTSVARANHSVNPEAARAIRSNVAVCIAEAPGDVDLRDGEHKQRSPPASAEHSASPEASQVDMRVERESPDSGQEANIHQSSGHGHMGDARARAMSPAGCLEAHETVRISTVDFVSRDGSAPDVGSSVGHFRLSRGNGLVGKTASAATEPQPERRDHFQELLKALNEEHERVKEENARLRSFHCHQHAGDAGARNMAMRPSELGHMVRAPTMRSELMRHSESTTDMRPSHVTHADIAKDLRPSHRTYSLAALSSAEVKTNQGNSVFGPDLSMRGSFDVWNAHFHVRDLWTAQRTADTGPLRALRADQVATTTSKFARRGDTLEGPMLVPDDRTDPRTRFVVNPSCTFRMCWDMSGLVLIGYDMITIPLQFFGGDPNIFTQMMDYITLVFWTLDMLQSFFVGYYVKGQLVMDHCKIVQNYMSTWFVVDLCVVAPDWIFTIGESGSAGDLVGLGRTLRATRAMRVLRLLRLLKLQRIINAVYDMIDSEYTFILLSLVRLLFFILILNHFLACIWFGIGRLGQMSGSINWIERSGYRPVADEDLGFQYTTSLHWSLTQFTPASMDVMATNTIERVYSIVVLFFAMVAFSSIVGSITGSMTTLRNIKGEEMKQLWLLRRYLKQRCISKALQEKILKFLEYKLFIRQKQVQKSSIKILSEISEPLSNELNNEMYYVHISGHPLFDYMTKRPMRLFLYRVCEKALLSVGFAEQDTVFEKGDDGRKMYFISNGIFKYTLGDELADIRLRRGDWISEASLWTTWQHRGQLQAAESKAADVIEVDPLKLCAAVMIHPRPWRLVTTYACHFVNFLNETPAEGLTDLVELDEHFKAMALRCEWPGRGTPPGTYRSQDTPDDKAANETLRVMTAL